MVYELYLNKVFMIENLVSYGIPMPRAFQQFPISPRAKIKVPSTICKVLRNLPRPSRSLTLSPTNLFWLTLLQLHRYASTLNVLFVRVCVAQPPHILWSLLRRYLFRKPFQSLNYLLSFPASFFFTTLLLPYAMLRKFIVCLRVKEC